MSDWLLLLGVPSGIARWALAMLAWHRFRDHGISALGMPIAKEPPPFADPGDELRYWGEKERA